MKNLTKVKVVLKFPVISKLPAKLTNGKITYSGLLYTGVFIPDKMQSTMVYEKIKPSCSHG